MPRLKSIVEGLGACVQVLSEGLLCEGINDPYIFKAMFMAGGGGSGKCLGPDVPVMLFDGSVKMARDVVVGDSLMGPDSLPRSVLGVIHASGPMYKVIPVKGDSFTCSENHILTVAVPHRQKIGGIEHWLGYRVEDVSVKTYLDSSNRFKRDTMLVRTGVDFESKPVLVDPYFLGIWLGDGHKHATAITTADDEVVDMLWEQAELWNLDLMVDDNDTRGEARVYHLSSRRDQKRDNNLLICMRNLGVLQNGFEKSVTLKHIPWEYKRNSKEIRLELLAGLIDSDGYLGCNTVEFVQKSKLLAEDFVWLARSLGMAAYISEKIVEDSVYWRVSLSGDLSVIPTRLPRKQADIRKQIKNVLHTGFIIERVDDGPYCSIEIDGDHRHLLGDFTITHNSFIAKQMFDGMGMKFSNSDIPFEYLLKKRGLSFKLDPTKEAEFAKQGQARERAKELAGGREAGWIDGMLGLIIDGTGKDYNKIAKQAAALKAGGYDVGMVFVNTTLDVARKRNKERQRQVPDEIVTHDWKKVQSNMGRFQQFFGPKNFFIVDNSKRLESAELQKLGQKLRRIALNWAGKPIQNPIGKDVVAKLRMTGGKTMADLRAAKELAASKHWEFYGSCLME